MAAYQQKSVWQGDNFFDNFWFDTNTSPTGGIVDYSPQSSGLAYMKDGTAYITVSTEPTVSGNRPSIRLESNEKWEEGLFILDANHFPAACGTWPAYWFVGSDWPNNGEIDVVEYVNADTTNAVHLHTGNDCTMSWSDGGFKGTWSTINCWVDAPNQGNNAGCGIHLDDDQTAGSAWNSRGGGVVAMEFSRDEEYIKVWMMHRDDGIPTDILNGTPNPDNWGEPSALFPLGSSCNPNNAFGEQQMVINTELCGQWAGNVWNNYPTCKSQASTCDDFVRENGAAMAEAYWAINSIAIYQWVDGDITGTPIKPFDGSGTPPAPGPGPAPVPAPVPGPSPGPPPADKKYCVPIYHANTVGGVNWACNSGDSTISCSDIPSDCDDGGEKEATFVYSKYYATNTQDGTCNFGGTAELTTTPYYPQCTWDYTEPVKVCSPIPGANTSGGVNWACTSGGVSCGGAPSGCTSGNEKATWVYSKYWDEHSSDGTCDFGGTAELTYTPEYPQCVYSADDDGTDDVTYEKGRGCCVDKAMVEIVSTLNAGPLEKTKKECKKMCTKNLKCAAFEARSKKDKDGEDGAKLWKCWLIMSSDPIVAGRDKACKPNDSSKNMKKAFCWKKIRK